MDDIVKARSSSKIYNCTHRKCTVRSAMGNKPRAFFYDKENDPKEEQKTEGHYFLHLNHLQ